MVGIDMKHLAAFRAVMLSGTVSGAAEALGRTQPAVSRLLDSLEDQLQLTLFDRRRGLITPTAHAHMLFDEFERTWASFGSLTNFADRLADGTVGKLTVGAMPALGTSFLPKVIARFRSLYPEVRVILKVHMSHVIEDWAATQQIDIGIAELPFSRTGFRSRIFGNHPFVAAVPANHPLASRSEIGPTDLNDGPFISWSRDIGARVFADQALQLAGVHIEPMYETTMSAAAYEMVKQGLGVALLDPYSAALRNDTEVRILPFRPEAPCNVALLWPEYRQPGPHVDVLVKLMTELQAELFSALPGASTR